MAVKEAAHARYSRSVIVNQAPINVIAGSDRLGSARLGSGRPGPVPLSPRSNLYECEIENLRDREGGERGRKERWLTMSLPLLAARINFHPRVLLQASPVFASLVPPNMATRRSKCRSGYRLRTRNTVDACCANVLE